MYHRSTCIGRTHSCSAAMLAALLMFSVGASAQTPAPTPTQLPPVQPLPAAAQPADVTGQIRRTGTLKPVSNATILVEGLSTQATSDGDGRFTLRAVPGGTQHIIVAAPGLMPIRTEVVIGADPPALLDVLLDQEVHYTEVVSVSPTARDQFESYQPTSVLAGQEFTKELEATLGATLQRQPGVAERSFGPGPSRPVIRGLDGDRVLILEDGQRVGDLSSQSGDHGVTTNPASASRIEVVRGPATLLYGANAIGGLVNVINETIPTKPIEGMHGGFVADFGSAAKAAGTAADVRWGNGTWAVHAGGSGRRNGDVDTPLGAVENTQSRAGFGSLGTAWTGARGFFGASYGYDDTKYGIPFVEDGQVELTPRRHTFAAKAGLSGMNGAIEGFRANFASRRYRHDELVAGEVGTRFGNDTDEFDLLVRHRKVGVLSGTLGAAVLSRRFSAIGEEALSPPVKERGTAGFFYEELTWPHVTFQFGARVNHASFDPEEDLPSRDFTDVSGSVGFLFRPDAGKDRVTVAVSLARAARNPALEELYFFGPHPGNFAFEVGNASLESERALGFDVALRWRTRRVNGEIGYFRNSIDDYIFRNPISEQEFDARFGGRSGGGAEEEHGEFPFIEFIAADSLLQGIEGHADVELGRGFGAEVGVDYVRGQLRALDQPLPRIPPFRLRTGLTYQRNAFQTGGEIIATAKQKRVFGDETPTAGYGNLRLFASYSFGSGTVVNTLTARLDNATNELYRNHLSLIKDFVPEMGRNFKVVYSLKF
ncbi:MAG TPA: TonB-dependent receptor [Vicinamibacterales bacterium]|nr:TonB-dependent receptor [Vicinamibacterales bacterium]